MKSQTFSYFIAHSQVTHSSGNHGQALAWAAQKVGIKCAVVAPNNSPAVKLEAIRGYGAEVVMCEPTPTDRYSLRFIIYKFFLSCKSQKFFVEKC